MNSEIKKEIVVLGSGPGGYSAAFRCADLGLETILIERYENIGGVCLNVGCIPSKMLLHIAKVIDDVKYLKEYGIYLNKNVPDIKKIFSLKNNIIHKISNNLKKMAKIRNIKIIKGKASFLNEKKIFIEKKSNNQVIYFNNAIIAVGSSPIKLPFIKENPRIWYSNDALELKKIPNRLLIIGAGIIGLEIATIYHTLGSEVDIVESNDKIIPILDKDIIDIYLKQVNKKFNIMLETKVISIDEKKSELYVNFKGKNLLFESKCYDIVLVAVGRTPNIKDLNLKKIGITIDKNNFIKVNSQMKTNIENIYAIGDVVSQPMLAHKAMHQGHIVAEIISGKKHYFNPITIPSIAYTNPEIAWVGLTEKKAKELGILYETAIFPWNASGRAIVSNAQNGITKLIFDKKTHRIIGGEIVGVHGGELLGEISLAIEMGCYAEDIALTIHAHPTLYESIGLCSEIFSGCVTDIINTKIKK